MNKLTYIRFFSRTYAQLFRANIAQYVTVLVLLMVSQLAHADINKVIDINVLDTDITEVMAMLSAKEQVNILVNKGVAGKISLNLYNVSVKNVIKAAARAGGYAAELIGDTFYIVQPEMLVRGTGTVSPG